jgi:hypothetical protein
LALIGLNNKYLRTELVNQLLLANHPHIIQMKAVFATSRDICLVMEFASEGTLLDRLEQQARGFAACMQGGAALGLRLTQCLVTTGIRLAQLRWSVRYVW